MLKSIRRAAQGPLSFSLFGLLAICAVFGIVLYDSYQDAESKTKTAAANSVSALSHDIARNVALFSLSLDAVVEGATNKAIMALPSEIRQVTLFDRSASAEGLGSIVLVDEEGNFVADSRATFPKRANVADREYFKHHRANADTDAFISHPFLGRINSNEWGITISKRINRPDGSFAGVVVGFLKLSYFNELFSTIDTGRDGIISVFHEDGTFIVNNTFDGNTIGVNLKNQIKLFKYFEENETGFYRTISFDRHERFYSYSRVGQLPLILSVGITTSEVFDAWWRKALTTCVALVGLCVAVLSLTLRLSTELKRRLETEAALRLMATTDPLTGAANRRSFELRANEEVARAIRDPQHSGLAALMIDIDHFKGFNDCYGHLSGDATLVMVAKAIEANCLRSPDFVARFGGEEFVVLLPQTTLSGATQVAERIRAAVSALKVEHAESTQGHITVSIGVAAFNTAKHKDCSELLRDADRALYIAKSSGRNRVLTSNSLVLLADRLDEVLRKAI